MTMLRPTLALALALMIAATSGAMAVARGHMASVAGHIIICSGGVSVRVAMDVGGQPLGPVHICPDCVLSLVDLPATDPLPQRVLVGMSAAFGQVTAPLPVIRLVPAHRARAPPAA